MARPEMKLINKIYGRVNTNVNHTGEISEANNCLQSPLEADSVFFFFFFEIWKTIGQPHPSTPASVMFFFSHFESFEKVQIRGRIREKVSTDFSP